MIPYEELVDALDRYVAKNGGTPQSARVPSSAGSFNSSSSSSPAPSSAPSSKASAAPAAVAAPAYAAAGAMDYEPHGHDVDLASASDAFDEPHDPDLPSLAGQHED